MKTEANNNTAPETRPESQACRCIAIGSLIVLLLALAASARGADAVNPALNPEASIAIGGLEP